MAVIRLDGDERRKAIVRAAVPLFARKGFAGTTTRELAEAAGISEALLFKHFPSKQLLYREIRQLGCEGDPALETLASLPPSTATLVWMMRFMVRHFLGLADVERDDLDSRLRLVAHSFLEDGEYARELFEAVSERVLPLFEASYEAAVAAGDIAARPGRPRNLFWFAQHVPAMLALADLSAGLSGRNCVPSEGTLDELAEEATAFILRGIGMRDDVIAAAAGQGRDAAAAPAAVD
jgi:TetR/AcrR family transcriptional regulator, transcriptional repressor of aconitase